MIRKDGKPPKLRAKAAEARYLLPVTRAMLEKLPHASQHNVLRLQCIQALDTCYRRMYNWSSGSGERVAALGRQHCILYTELARESVEASRNLLIFWKVYPKHHMFLHCVEWQLRFSTNPVMSWCYPDEGDIAKAVQLAESSHPRTRHRTIMERYIELGSFRGSMVSACACVK